MEVKDLVRQSILLGLGGYQYVKDGIEDIVKKLEDDGKLTPEEGKKFVDEVLSDAKKSVNKEGDSVKKFIKDVLSDVGVVTKDDIEELKKDLTQ